MDEKNTDVNVLSNAPVESLADRHLSSKKRRKKYIVIAVAVIVVIAVMGFSVFKLIDKSGYNGAVDDYMTAFIAKDHKAITDSLSSYYTALKLSGVSIAENIKYFNNVIDNAHTAFSENLGEEYTVTYEITSVDNMSAKEFEAMVNALSFGGYNAKSIITEAIRVELTITAEAENDMTNVLTLLLTKEDDKWCILNIE